ncbi:MOSC domain-containing protein [Actinoplanes sp. HUAS TT8]|uniref:MOSC domain-containing protein n=1 Tax=Actinoplanes sp. HUAS TT8 TaxID=3447453 RepID=UPI003F51D404
MSADSGTVAAVSRNDAYTFSKPNRDEIVLVAGLGVEGDIHAGVNVRHRSRVRADPAQPNLRQVHLIQAELFDEVAGKGFDVPAGGIGENVTTRGLDLLALPRGTILRFGPPPDGAMPESPGEHPVRAVLAAAASAELDEATARATTAVAHAVDRDSGADPRAAVVLAGLRNPCAQINTFRPGLLKEVLGQDDHGHVVRRAGVMGVVLRGGPIRPGDPVAVELPPGPREPLERV